VRNADSKKGERKNAKSVALKPEFTIPQIPYKNLKKAHRTKVTVRVVYVCYVMLCMCVCETRRETEKGGHRNKRTK
jgi:hypothetical protein